MAIGLNPTVEGTLTEVTEDLQKCLQRLRDPAVAKQLQEALHNPEKLPDKKVSSLAGEALDLLGDIDLILEPGQLILADHFLGA